MMQMRSDHHTLLLRLEELLLAALPPLFQKVRAPAVQALAHRSAALFRTGTEVTAAAAVAALRGCLDALATELSELEAQAQAFTRAFQEAKDEKERRAVLVEHLEATVPKRGDRWKDLRALKRWMGFDALRERLERRRMTLLVQEELALRCIKGLLSPKTKAELCATAAACLARALVSTRPQNQLAAMEAVAAALKADPSALDDRAGLTELLERPQSGPWLAAAAFDALIRIDPDAALQRFNLRTGPRDFLFRRQALELAAEVIDPARLLPLLDAVAQRDPSQYVRMGAAELLVPLPERAPVLLQLAGLGNEPEPAPKVRATALVAASRVVAQRAPNWEQAAQLFAVVVEKDADPLVLRIACELLTLLAGGLATEDAVAIRQRLIDTVSALTVRGELEGAVVEAAAGALQALQRASNTTRSAWTRYLGEALSEIAPGGRLKVRVSPPPSGLPPLPEDDALLGAILAELSRDDYGLYATRRGATLEIRRGERLERKAWRTLHELSRPAPNKRQGFRHTVGRTFGGELRAHPLHLDEITATSVPGERVHIAEEGSWGRHLPTVDDLLDLPLDGRDVRLFSSHGITTVTPPPTLSRRIKNRVALTTRYDKLASLRLSSLRGKEGRERRRYLDEVKNQLGVTVRFTPYQKDQCPPPRLASLFGSAASSGRPGSGALQAFGLVEGTLVAQALDVLIEQNDYFFGTRGNGVTALAVFTAAVFSYFLADAWRKRDSVRRAREVIPLCIGGWGTRGKSGTERLKAALFTGLGFDVFAKTTGSEAMFVHTAPTGVSNEFFIFRPYDKATIWEQRDMAALAARLGTEVFLWECMALQPDFVDLLQNEWMRDDFATLTNAYPDHEDIQGPSGADVAEVISRFIPEGRTVVTTEDHFLPLFRQAAKEKGTTLIHSPWWEAELIPEELLALFPYREHPRNMALVATLAEQLGIPRSRALGLMAEHVQPEIGVLKVFPKVKVRGRQLTFINGHSANERTGFLNNWTRTGLDKLDPLSAPDQSVVTVINNRWDRVARSEVFARILVEDAPADRHLLIGTNLEGLTRYVRDALEVYTARMEVVSPEDLLTEDGKARAHGRLEQHLLRLKVPPPDLASFIDRLQRWAYGAGLDLSVDHELTTLVSSALASDGEVHVAAIRKELEATVAPLLEGALRKGVVSDDPGLPEALESATRDEVIDHALYLLARMVVHARLRRLMPIAATADSERRIAAFHQKVHTAYRELFLEQLVPVPDAQATGDQIIDACARSVPPGQAVSIMGAQNIKGTGLDWVYRWMAVDKVHGALTALETGSEDERRRAFGLLESFADSGLVDAALAHQRLVTLAQATTEPGEAEHLLALAQRYQAIHALKRSALETTRSGTRTERVVRSVEKIFDYLDSVRRRNLSQQLVDDLVHGRVSHARAAIETRRLYERQKGGWLLGGLKETFGRRQLEAGVPPSLPARSPRPGFDEALRAPHDMSVKVPSPGVRREDGAGTPPRAEAPDSQQDA